MKRLFFLLISGILGIFLGVVLAGSLNMRSAEAAGTEQPPTADGEPVYPVEVTLPSPAPNAALAATNYLEFGSWEFRPAISTLTYSPLGAAMYAVTVPPGGQSFKCPVHLPNGVQVTRVLFYIVDNSSTDNMILQFYRAQPAANTSQYEIGYVSTVGLPTSTAVQTVAINGAPTLTTIDNQNYAYSLRYGPSIEGNLHMLVGAQIQYSYPTFVGLPIINR